MNITEFMRRYLLIFILLLIQGISAQVNNDTIRVGYASSPPFIFQNNGELTGINIWLWEQISKEQNIEYKYISMEFSDLIPALNNDELDVCINPLTITSERVKTIDFTYPYLASNSTIAIREVSSLQRFWFFIKGFFNLNFIKAVIGLIAFIFLFGLIGWYFERRKNPDDFRNGWKGIWDGIWWSAVTLTTVGYGDKSPKSSPGKLVALVLMFFGLLFISGLTARMTSSLTIDQLNMDQGDVLAFKDKKVGTVANSSTVDFLKTKFFKDIESYSSVKEGLLELQKGRIDAFLYDEPILRYRINNDSTLNGINILPIRFDVQFYSFGLNKTNTDLNKQLSESILDIIERAQWEILLNEYDMSNF